ncbi:MAG: glycosyltransferase, partial [Acidimicrobiales bacterium]
VLEAREDIVLVRCGTNLGFGGGNNLAATIGRGRFLLFVNDDSALGPAYIGRLVTTAMIDESIGAVAGRILSTNGELQEAGSVIWDDGWVQHIGHGQPGDAPAFSYVRDIDYGSANGLLVRREAWEAAGGFDERYFPAYYEDVDLCMALRARGYRILYEPRATLVHLESQSTSDEYRKFLLIRNRDQFIERWRRELTGFAGRPADGDRPAVARAVHRSDGSPPLLVAVAGHHDTPDTSMSAEAWWNEIEALAADGWGVTVLSASAPGPGGSASAVPGRLDRLVDLGVDLRDGAVDQLIVALDPDVEAVLVPTGYEGQLPPIVRPDGSVAPLVPGPGGQPADRAEPMADAITRVARRTPSRSHSSPAARYAGRMKAPGAGGEGRSVLGGDGGPRVGQGTERESATEAHTEDLGPTADLTARELRAAKADSMVRQEFAQTLEAELDVTRAALGKTNASLEETTSALGQTKAALDETSSALATTRAQLDETTEQLASKVAYIEALPSVRLKAWANDLHRKPKR